MLLILDNFEHLLPAAPLVGDLLSACPSLVVLVTSRAGLALYGEHTVQIPALALADPAAPPAPERAGEFASLRLFEERARAANSAFALTAANTPAVAAICARLDGLPLAIELAAARSKVLSPPAMLERLGQRLPLLGGGPRDAPERQQTLHATIAWSYDLLTPEEQRLFRQLAVFVGGWTLDAAEAVCETDPESGGDIFGGLIALTDRSLVHQIIDPDGDGRFAFLETIREFAHEQLQRDDRHAYIEAQHAAFFTRLMEYESARLRSREHHVAIERLEQDLGNVRAAWEWIERHRDGAASLAERLLRSQERAWLFWREQGRIEEARTRIQSLLDAYPVDPTPRAIALIALGHLATERSATDDAHALHEAALEIARIQGDRRLEGRSLFGVARAVGWTSTRSDALRIFEQALDLARATSDRSLLFGILHDLGDECAERGDYERSIILLREALLIAEEDGDDVGKAVALAALAERAQDYEHDLAKANDLLRQSLVLLRGPRGTRRSRFSASILDRFAKLALAGGLPERAARLFGAVEAVFESIAAPMPPFYRPIFDRNVATTRQLLGDKRWERAWNAGRAMSFDQVIVYALAEPVPEAEPPAGGAAGVSASLSRRELDVLRLLADGKSNQEVADALFISPHTVATHVANIMNKLGVDSRTGAALLAVRQGLV
jgi:non-specific serine/threonine protein kinase